MLTGSSLPPLGSQMEFQSSALLDPGAQLMPPTREASGNLQPTFQSGMLAQSSPLSTGNLKPQDGVLKSFGQPMLQSSEFLLRGQSAAPPTYSGVGTPTSSQILGPPPAEFQQGSSTSGADSAFQNLSVWELREMLEKKELALQMLRDEVAELERGRSGQQLLKDRLIAMEELLVPPSLDEHHPAEPSGTELLNTITKAVRGERIRLVQEESELGKYPEFSLSTCDNLVAADLKGAQKHGVSLPDGCTWGKNGPVSQRWMY
eukprot:TRINITY_DN9289_c2_g1_i2.p1 TRINITY_DN9289_c2_g1~~TRINITY_DN9289_c2_g1_i2.p1  ORF type:complete len:261 (-),score=42.58 TRINITY_DN9289_c2_g1_i2:146-928(-)